MPLRTRPPTGLSSWPLILVDGLPKMGKSCLCYEFSASPLVGDTFVFQIGERAADEYGPLGRYQIVDDLDGTWADFYDQLVQATLMPRTDPDRPNVIVVDSGSEAWSGLRDWVDSRARNSDAARAILKKDPDAAITRGQNLWNDANDRWAHMLKLLAAWDGIAIITARGDEVTAYENGQPAANGRKAYRADVHNYTPSVCTAIVSLRDYRQPRLTALTKLGFEMPASGYVDLPRDGALEHLVFEILGLSVENRQRSHVVGVAGTGGYLTAATKVQLIQNFKDRGFSDIDAKAAAIEVWHGHYPPGTEVDAVPQSVWDQMLADIEARVSAPPAEGPSPAPEPAPAATPEADPGEAEPEAVEAPGEADEQSAPSDDPVEAARAFAKAHGGDPDAGEGFTYDEDDTADDIPDDDEDESDAEGGA